MNPQENPPGTALRSLLDQVSQVADGLEEENRSLKERLEGLETTLERIHGAATTLEGAHSPEERALTLSLKLEQQVELNERLSQESTELERQNSNFLSLYVASSQIHATLVYEDVLRIIKEVVINLIGADRFAIYVIDQSAYEIRREATEGQLEAADAVIPLTDNLLSRAAQSGTLMLEIHESDLPSGQTPLAILPLTVGDKTVGLVVLFRLLVQKDGFDAFDMDLFSLLSAHAATALYSSLQYRRLERKVQTLQGLLDLFKTTHASGGG